MSQARTELQREVVEALVSTKAINFEVVGNVLSKFGARAALSGDALCFLVGKHAIDICIPPFQNVSREVLDVGQAER